nr:hypothetical protein [Tanacetum cinerariifolium]
MLRTCYEHCLTKGTIIPIFYHGLDDPTQGILDAKGLFLYHTPNEAFKILEDKVLLKLEFSEESQNSPKPKTVVFASGSNNNTDHAILVNKFEALVIKVDSEFLIIRKKLKEMRDDDVLLNHVGDEEFKSIDDIENEKMTKKEIKKDENGVPKELNKEWKLNEKVASEDCKSAGYLRNKPDLDTISFNDLYNNFMIVEQEVKGTISSSSSSQNMAFVSSPSNTNEVNNAYRVSTANTQVSSASTQEFQQLEFEGYRPKTSNSVSKDISNEVKESPDAPLVKELVSDDKLEKKTAFPTFAKIEIVIPKQQEKPVRKLVKYAEMYRCGYVAFGGDPKGGKITSKGKISTDTECVVLSLNFNLLDESHVLLRVPRKNNMYSVDLKNVAPSGGLTCLFEKSTLDESNLWHRRLGYINFKTMNKLNTKFKLYETILGICYNSQYLRSSREWTNLAFDIDTLKKSMNYKPVIVKNQSNGSVGKAMVDTLPNKDYILIPLWTQYLLLSFSSKDSPGACCKPSGEEEKKDAKDSGNEENEELRVSQEKDSNVNNTNNINTVSPTANAAGIKDNAIGKDFVFRCADDLNMPNLEEDVYSDDDEDVGAEADMTNLDTNIHVSPIPTTRIHKDHPVEQIIKDIHSAPQTIRMIKNVTNHEPKKRNKKDERGIVVRNKASPVTQGYTQEARIDYDEVFSPVTRIEAIRLIEEDVYVCQPLGFEDPKFPDRVYKVEKALYGLYQAHRAWKEMCIEFEKMMHKKFQMSSIGDLTFFLGLQVTQKDDGIFISQDKYVDEVLKKFGFLTVKTTNTPMETLKPLLKDENAKMLPLELQLLRIYLIYKKETSHIEEDADFAEIGYFLNVNPIRFLQLFLNNQIENLEEVFNDEYDAPSHTKKVFANMRRQGKDFSRRVTLLFESMQIQHPGEVGEDKTIHEERGDIVERAATTAASLEAEQDSDTINRTQSTVIHNEPIPQGTSSVLALENNKTAQDLEITPLKNRVKRFLDDQEDASNQERNDQDEEISFVQEDVETQGRYDHDIKVNTISTSITTASINISTAEPVTTVSVPVTTAGVSISTDEPSTPPPKTTTLIGDEELIITQTLMKIGTSETASRPIIPPQQQLDPKDKGKGIMQEPEKLVKVKGKDQIALDEEFAQGLEAQMQAKFDEE